jgi:hypothetical protein
MIRDTLKITIQLNIREIKLQVMDNASSFFDIEWINLESIVIRINDINIM